MILALIPARAGSKGIKNKNLVLLDNKPLIYHTIQAAKNSKYINKIVVSSDGDSILKYANEQNVETLQRPKELALDNTKSHEVVMHAIKNYMQFDTIILLQPTSPFRNSYDIDNAFKIFLDSNANALISVTEYDNKILKAFIVNENNELKGICNDEFPFMLRQELPKTYMSNGAIYIIKRDLFINNPTFLPSNTSFYVMDEKSSIDIDTQKDLEFAKNIIYNNT